MVGTAIRPSPVDGHGNWDGSGHRFVAVAQHARISQPALSRIEGGGGVPTLATLGRLARAMGTTFAITVGQDTA
ncbi:helix-turn-helix transcriptional regulator [Nonomuraea sp. NPDC046802]|uniref:helix-turn-helix domain-containing protein n=1 Tax=Nonomuraea sp. NPDC046802 TaxID=3154919 RepID=UPI0033CF1227